MRQLDQVEKRLLRILAIQKQMSNTGAVDDFAKTINNTANVLKQMSETWKEIGRWIGQLTMVYLAPFLEKFLGFSIALREILKSMNIMQGYKYENAGASGGFEFIENGAENAENAIESATEAVESLKSILLGFDKLNILGSNTSTSTLLGDVSDYKLITDQIAKYSSQLDDVQNKSNSIAESILTRLGYQKIINEYEDEEGKKVQEIYYTLEGSKSYLGDILALIGSISAGIIAFSLSSKLTNIGNLIGAIGTKIGGISTTITGILTSSAGIGTKISKIVTALGGVQIVVAAIVALFAYMYTTNEEFKASIDNLLKTLGEALLPVMQAIMLVIDAIMPIVNTIINEIVHILVPVIDAISPIIKTIGDLITSLLPVIKVILDVVSNILNVGLELIFTVLQPFIGQSEMVVDLLSIDIVFGINLIKNAVEIVMGVFQTLVELIKTLFSGDWASFGEKIKEIWVGVGESIRATFVGVINGIIKAFATFVNSFSSKINDLTGALSGLWEWVGIPAIPNIPQWEPKLIPLASGGVITQPTAALVGEYAGAKTNPEIVTPENLMREIFIESMMPIAQAILSGNQQVVKAIQENGEKPIELNGRKVSEAIYDDLRNVAIRKGNNLSFAR